MASSSTYYSFLAPSGGSVAPTSAPPTGLQLTGPPPLLSSGYNGYSPGWSGKSAGPSGYSPAGRTIDLFPNASQGPPGAPVGPPGTPGAPPPSTNPADQFTLVNKIKDPAQDARIKALGQDYEALKTSGAGDIHDFTSAWRSSLPGVQARAAQESDALSRWYTGGVAGDMANLRSAEDLKFQALNDQLLGAAARARSANELVRGGSASGLGGNTYNVRAATRDVGGIMATENVRQIAQRRADEEAVRAAQERLAERRSGITANALRAITTPAQTGLDWYNRLSGAVGGLGAMGDQNRITGLTKPYDPNTEGYFPGYNQFGGPGNNPRAGGAPGNRGVPPVANQPANQGGLYRDPVTGRPMSQAEVNTKFPGGGYRDQYGRWMTPDANGVWRPQAPDATFDPGWNVPPTLPSIDPNQDYGGAGYYGDAVGQPPYYLAPSGGGNSYPGEAYNYPIDTYAGVA